MSRSRPSRTHSRHRPRRRVGTAVLLPAVILTLGAAPATTAVPAPAATSAAASAAGPVVVERVVRAPVVVAPGSPAPAAVAAPAPMAAAAAAPVSPAVALTDRWTWPVGPPHDLVRSFEAPASRYGPGHRGIDIVAGPGEPVRAPADGVVSFSGTVVDRPVLSIQHAEDLVSSFEPVAATVTAGDSVRAGQVVGVVASGAHCTDKCLHFGVRRHGQYISPVLFLGGLSRAVLLPLPPAGPLLHPPH
jgi:murein DD-endopeptidase MepM/ murein hydrolase activator NlpD